MPKVSTSRRVGAPQQIVFDVATDLQNAAEHVDGIERIEMLTPGPFTVGTRWRETRVMMGREATEELAVTECNPPESYAVECQSCGAHYKSTFRFDPVGHATNLVFELESRPQTLLAKVLSPVPSLFMGKTVKKYLESDLDSIQRAAEARASAV